MFVNRYTTFNRFAYVNGRVESVCPGSEEETWVVNLKRAVVSAIQNNMHDLNTDTDTREVCPLPTSSLKFIHKIQNKNCCTCVGYVLDFILK